MILEKCHDFKYISCQLVAIWDSGYGYNYKAMLLVHVETTYGYRSTKEGVHYSILPTNTNKNMYIHNPYYTLIIDIYTYIVFLR